MNKELTSMMELTSFLDLHDGDHLLELTTGHDLIAPILKSLNPNLNYTIDLCQLENVMINCEAIGYYHRIFFMNGLDSLAFEYDTIFISMIFNTFSKEEGLALLNKLVKQMKKNLYFIIEEEFPQNIWTLQDFKDFDLSFFNLGQSQQKLINLSLICRFRSPTFRVVNVSSVTFYFICSPASKFNGWTEDVI